MGSPWTGAPATQGPGIRQSAVGVVRGAEEPGSVETGQALPHRQLSGRWDSQEVVVEHRAESELCSECCPSTGLSQASCEMGQCCPSSLVGLVGEKKGGRGREEALASVVKCRV